MLIDTHAHLTDERYKDSLDDIINNLKINRIEKVFTVAYNRESIIKCVELAEKYKNIYAIIGIHPEDVNDLTEETEELIKKYATHPKVVAIGEIGLDYHYEGFDKEKQARAFIRQLKLANELKLPVCIHNRDSIGDCLKILKENKEYLTYGGVIHCYSESVEIYREIKKLGLKISFGGTLTFKNSHVAPKVCEVADIDDILIETDCPYLTPHPFRGQTNEPKYTTYVAEKIALIKGISYDTVVDITTKNALNLFKKAND
jgi:TatD DNase family protein